MNIQIIEIRELAHVNLAIYTVDGVKCATFVRKGEMPFGVTVAPVLSWEERVIPALEAAGLKVREWSKGGHHRYYLSGHGYKDMGYIEHGADGKGNGVYTTRRSGWICELLRAA